MLISLTEYAAMHDREESTIRKKCLRGGFKTARKIGRNWVIDSEEPMTDLRQSQTIKEMRSTKMNNYEALKAWFSNKYGESTIDTIAGHTGHMYGYDECFDTDSFYQYFLTQDGELLKMYFETPEDCEDYGNIDYDKPYRIASEDVNHWINYVI